MPLPDEGPCSPWITWDDVLAVCPLSDADLEKLNAIPADVRQFMLDDANSLAFDLSEQRYPGECEITRTLCAACSCRQATCCCRPRDEIVLGGRWPIGSVTEVIVDGTTLTDLTDYRVDNWNTLVRLGGESWPRCVDVEDPEAFQVTWTFGRNPPAAARRALARMVAEEAKSCAGLKCELPKKTTSYQRENVTVTLVDSNTARDDGKTGFLPFDRWLDADKRKRRVAPGAFDPDACGEMRAVDTGQPDVS